MQKTQNYVVKHFKKFAPQLILLGIIYLAITLSALFMPLLMSNIIEYGIRKANMEYIWQQGGIMLALGVFSLVASLLKSKLNSIVATGFSKAMRAEIFNKVNSMTFDEFSEMGTGGLLTRSTDDVDVLQETASQIVYVFVGIPVMFIGGVLMSMRGDWLLAVILLAVSPIALVLVWFITRNMGNLWENSDKYMDKQNQIVRERLFGIRVIRAFDKEDYEHSRTANATDTMAVNIIKANVISGTLNPLLFTILNLATVFIVYIGAVRLQTEKYLLAGDIVATIQYIALIINALLMLSWTMAFFPHIKVCTRRINELMNKDGMKSGVASGEKLNGSVKMSSVNFRYGNAESNVLTDINIDCASGEIVGIIGGTGSGKSSLIKLLLGFYEVSDGEVSLGGVNYSDMSKETARDNISVALQKNMIFEGTIRENILMGNPLADDEKLENIAKISQIAEFVHGNPDGYDYKLMQTGSNISGGQKQRINIARTIIKDASVYIFDDSFSALDYLTEANLRKALNKYLKGKTQIIVTQRAATAMRCDKVYCIDQGKIVGVGNHKKLLATCPIYAEIYRSQLGGDGFEKTE
ncbi:MAG: ABC transporter ATP-binding protein [Clostridia bacterium]